jgi:glycine dehydrogenase subunit 1
MLQTCIYLATLGKNGLQEVAKQSYDKAHYAAQLIDIIPGYHVVPKLFFREFLVETPDSATKIVEALNKKSIMPGLALSHYYPERANELLICVTEMNTKAQIEKLASALKEAVK